MPLDLAYAAYGAGPPLVILHGLFGSSGNWTSIAKRLAATRRVFAVDLRNHGASPWSDTMSYADMVEDLAIFLRRHGLTSVALLGHSMGGKAAMMTALVHGRLVERLIVIDVAPVAYPPVLGAYVKAMRALDLAGVSRRGEADEQLAQRISERDIRRFLLQNLVQDPDGFRWRLNLDAIAHAMSEISGFPRLPADATYPGPVLFIRGARSDYVLDAYRDQILRLFPRSDIVTVPESGHWVHAEQPQAMLDAVNRFLVSS